MFPSYYNDFYVLQNILCIDECPRTDYAYVVALTTLQTLSLDYARVVQSFKQHSIIELMWDILKVCEDLPPVVLESCLNLLVNQVSGPVSIEVLEKLKNMTASLTRTARLIPEHSRLITEIMWKVNITTFSILLSNQIQKFSLELITIDNNFNARLVTLIKITTILLLQ